jgi:SAM-dependent methyltransferase
VNRRTPPNAAAERLIRGERLRVSDDYQTGASILHALHVLLKPPHPSAPFAARQAFEKEHRETSLRLLAPIQGHRLALRGAAPIGLLAELYPRLDRFWLPMVEAQALHGAWDRYQEGTHLAVLGQRVHPYYGTYAPTRVSHLELFATWLSRYDGGRAQAVDVGTGCGVLALMLARAGFSAVHATDVNPNAIESVSREVARRSPTPPISLACTDLLGELPAPADLVVFNPPWIPGTVNSLLDRALYFDDDLFARFFRQAEGSLRPGGRVVLVFSSAIRLLRPDAEHPIEAELARGTFSLVEKLQRRVRTEGRRTRERVEVWELAQS